MCAGRSCVAWRIEARLTPDDPPGHRRQRPDTLRLAAWIGWITLILVVVLGLLAYTDIWLF